MHLRLQKVAIEEFTGTKSFADEMIPKMGQNLQAIYIDTSYTEIVFTSFKVHGIAETFPLTDNDKVYDIGNGTGYSNLTDKQKKYYNAYTKMFDYKQVSCPLAG